MNLKELVQKCAMLLDRDGELDGLVSSYTTEQQQLYQRLVSGINTAYLSIARDQWRTVHTQSVTTDTEGRVAVSSLEKQFLSLLRAEREGKKVAARDYKDYIYIYGLSGTAAELFYYYLPDALTDEADSPILPESAVDPMAYVYFAVSLYYTVEKRHSEAAAWDLRYRNIVDNITEARGSLTVRSRRWR